MKKIALIAVFSCWIVGCSSSVDLPAPSQEMVQATDSLPGILHILNSRSCTGTLVSRQAVLTAAHCMIYDNRATISVSGYDFITNTVSILGTGDVNDSQDLALLIFTDPILTDEDVIPVSTQATIGDEVALVGYGCNDPITQQGVGTKRMGTNKLYRISDYLEVLTPNTARAVFGPSNRAGSCQGDSGGPLLKKTAMGYQIIGVDHAGTEEDGGRTSQFIDLNRAQNMDFLKRINREHSLNIQGLAN